MANDDLRAAVEQLHPRVDLPEHHRRGEWTAHPGVCGTCWDGSRGAFASWPCPTMQALAAHAAPSDAPQGEGIPGYRVSLDLEGGEITTSPATIPAPASADTGLSEEEAGEAYYREHGWGGCDGAAWHRLTDATKRGWEHAARLSDRLAAVVRERDSWQTAAGRCKKRADDAENAQWAAEAEVARLRAVVAAVEALADDYDTYPNWREWGVPQAIRAALATGTEQGEEGGR